MTIRLDRAGMRIRRNWLVRDVSMVVRPNRITALVGPNGSGKSTVLRLLAGLWQPSEGRVLVDGSDMASLGRRDLARQVAFVPQNPRIDVPFTVRHVVSMGRHPHLGRFESAGPRDLEVVESALARVDVLHLAERRVNELSGGEFQRVVVARSLATEADVILLDEPTSNLDLDHSLETLELLRRLAEDGKAVAAALHDLNAVARWADHATLMHRGRLRAHGPVGQVLADEQLVPVFDVDIERLQTSHGVPDLVFHRRIHRSGESSRAERGRDADENRLPG
ncbi:MAG: ABC transporter ATP-binding protein [Bryobacterales bacterium]|nr:ABC transporter ATP-binding protein [Bryobacterales bacterium]